MPTHRIAIKKLLDVVERRIAEAEARIVMASSDDERTRVVESVADLHVRRHDLMAALLDNEPAK